MNRCLHDLVSLLDLEPLEVNLLRDPSLGRVLPDSLRSRQYVPDALFRGQSRDLGGKSVFGGQVIGQALVAAGRTVEAPRAPHSLHAYFLRPGDMAEPIVYEVDRIRDGRSFTARRVQAIQRGAPILSMIASFQNPEAGLEHEAPMPDVPPPEKLKPQHELRREWLDAMGGEVSPRLRAAFLRELAIEFRPVQPWNPLAPEVRAPHKQVWFRATGQLPDDPMLHRCVLAYASDFNLLSTALLPHGRSYMQRDMIVASIDHALWFHRAARVDDWLLYTMDSPSAQGARGFSRGLIFDRAGRLVASVAQESLMRRVAAALSPYPSPASGRGE